ncbi:16S rRNA (cytosine(967)-C(5))-methyltransferase RsmB [bacterium]|nr:16S rRNA (cytosine(967)-C(5))-methyltransferase RsmB [bacterium]
MATLTPRAQALKILIDVEQRGAFANLALQGLSGISPRDRALITELVNGTVRRRRTLDHVLSAFVRTGLDKLTAPIRNNLRMGAYQLFYTSGIPAHAAIDEAVKLAHRYGHSGVAKLTNAVLRRVQREGREVPMPDPAREPVAAIGVRESLPDWLVSRWVEAYGLEVAAELATASNHPTPMALRANTLKIERDTLLAQLREAGLDAEPSPVVSEGLRFAHGVALSQIPAYNEGTWYVQGEAAMLASRVVDPQPGETVLDIGAAPGGKTTHLAALMRDEGRVIAVDPHEGRLELVAENAARLGEHIVTLRHQDGTAPFDVVADRILVDAPCSGFGVLYRKSDLRWHQTPEQVDALPAEQLAILASVAKALKPGGVMVYATCTINPAENEAVVRDFLAAHPDFKPGDIRPYLPEAWREEAPNGMIQLLPSKHGVEGFFIARMERTHG